MPRKLKVLVAHHERVVADTLVMVMHQVNVEAVAAYSGIAALELALSANPDVAILCIVPSHLDDLNGVYAAVVVRALMPACRILLFPGGSGGRVIEPLTLASAGGYHFEVIAEPIHPNDLLEMLSANTCGDIEPIQPRSNWEDGTTQPQQMVVPDFPQPQSKRTIWTFLSKFTGRG